MAAVAAEPGAAAVPTTTPAAEDEAPPDPPGRPEPTPEPAGPREAGQAASPAALRAEDGADEQGRHVRPEPATGGARPEGAGTEEPAGTGLPDRAAADRFSPGLPGDPEGGGNVSAQEAYRSIPPDPQPSAVFLHSFPAPPPVTEAGLSLAEPAEPTTNVTTNRAEAAGGERSHTAELQGPAAGAMLEGPGDRLSLPGDPDPGAGYGTDPDPGAGYGTDPDPGAGYGTDPDPGAGYGTDPPGPERPPGPRDASPPGRAPKARAEAVKPEDPPEPRGAVQDLSPGSEVRVCLDHVIDDALVVSFRVGEKLFSGVLMDTSKRFGPFGIPITLFPRRDDHGRPPVSLQPPVDDLPTKQEVVGAEAPPPAQPWTSKPPPLFQEGAPYPPPLFIRDTYNQALPQPPPRKIKRPKRRYRCEEPTSIMNAIRLRPRQVLCDKCKGVAASGGHRELRRGRVDLRGEEASRRRRQTEAPLSYEVKRLRNDDKAGRHGERRPSGIRVSSPPPSSSRRVLRAVAASSASPAPSGRMRLKLNSKKVLTKGPGVEPPPRRPRDPQDADAKAVTRAAALRSQKVHFTRRHLSGAGVAATALPPRMRLKPQSTTLKSC